jgi:predicted RNase H-like HicB family nuclease
VAELTRYRLVIERDESGAWIGRVPDVPGCHAYGRTLRQLRRRIREALSLYVSGADTAELIEELRLPREVRDALRRNDAARRRLEASRRAAGSATGEAVRTLVEDLNLGLRDAGELLGLSHQRVQQLVRNGD